MLEIQKLQLFDVGFIKSRFSMFSGHRTVPKRSNFEYSRLPAVLGFIQDYTGIPCLSVDKLKPKTVLYRLPGEVLTCVAPLPNFQIFDGKMLRTSHSLTLIRMEGGVTRLPSRLFLQRFERISIMSSKPTDFNQLSINYTFTEKSSKNGAHMSNEMPISKSR